MMKRIVARGTVVAVAALALTGLGALATLMSGDGTRAVAGDEVAIDTTGTLAVMESRLAVTRGELDRAHRILDFSGRYRIPADMASRIYDHAVNEGIPPALGFQLVKIESNFVNSATSYASAIGLTQLALLTARSYEPTLAPDDLMNPDVSLRIGFRYLKDLLKRYDNDLELALEAYNKGPTLVSAQMSEGIHVKGRYSRAVLRGM
jgi:soluble lytic murein transglycosylase-like protein